VRASSSPARAPVMSASRGNTHAVGQALKVDNRRPSDLDGGGASRRSEGMPEEGRTPG
jgi:hypothetical protein